MSDSAIHIRTADRQFFWLLFATLCAFSVWSWVGTLEIVSVATGDVIPSTAVKTVQHLEGGIISKILVKEGDSVKAEQALVELANVANEADSNELYQRLAGLRVEVLRLEAESNGSAGIAFPTDLMRNHPELVQQANHLFNARRERLNSDALAQREIVTQRERSIQEIEARIHNAQESLKYLNEQVTINEDLLKEKIASQYEQLSLLRERSSMQSRVEEDKAAVQGARAAAQQARARMNYIHAAYREEVRTNLEQKRREMHELQERMHKFEDSSKRTVMRSPVDGVVKTLYFVTTGGVIKAGDAVMDIVPAGDRLVIEARLPTQDVGYVRARQEVKVRLAAANLTRFGSIDGHVAYVSPDAMADKEGLPYYRVRIEVERDYFEDGEMRYKLYPGMQVMASIVTGNRRVAEYLLEPLLGHMSLALQER